MKKLLVLSMCILLVVISYVAVIQNKDTNMTETKQYTEEINPVKVDFEYKIVDYKLNDSAIQETNDLEVDEEIVEEVIEESEPEIIEENEVVFTEENAKDFYKDSVFIGDSVMLGFQYYNMNNPDNLPGAQFLVSPGYSASKAAFAPQDYENHPEYEGERDYIWNTVKKMGVKKVILFFGINDFNVVGLEGTRDTIVYLGEKIKEENSDMDVYFLSATPLLTGHDSGELSNNNIRLLNEMLQEYCFDADFNFIDIYQDMIDEEGGLNPAYCSDGFLHICYEGYAAWTESLIKYVLAD